MILGVGVDLCEVSRMAEAISHPRFMERVFSEAERAYLNSRGIGAAQTAAGLYAAKEAYLKARGTGIDTLALSSIDITHSPLGQPRYAFSGLDGIAAHLSISHDGGMAIALCVLERLEERKPTDERS